MEQTLKGKNPLVSCGDGGERRWSANINIIRRGNANHQLGTFTFMDGVRMGSSHLQSIAENGVTTREKPLMYHLRT